MVHPTAALPHVPLGVRVPFLRPFFVHHPLHRCLPHFRVLHSLTPPESSSLVSLPGLKRAYEILQLGAADDSQVADPAEINVEAHFSVVDSFDMPAVHFDVVRSGFTTSVSISTRL
jgi:hypothetical protein